MSFEHYVRSGNKILRCGYTTGTCAALAAKAAAIFAVTGKAPYEVSVMTGKGIKVTVETEEIVKTENGFICSVKKDAGDDIDVTQGAMILAELTLKEEPGIDIKGGKGVGRVTKPGLDQPLGNAAINSTPRRMIEDAVTEVFDENSYEGGCDIVISVPSGEELASKTFNPNLGIEGGISIIGTSGIVEPMSEKALIDTIEVEMKQRAEESKDLIITPGNYGETYLEGSDLSGIDVPVVKISNFLGEALDMASNLGLRNVLLVSHIGKLIKVAGAIMNTHSRYADARNEIFAAHAALAGAGKEAVERVMKAATTDSIIEILDAEGIRGHVMESVLAKVQEKLDHRAGGAYRTGAVTFSNVYGYLGETDGAKAIISDWK